MNKENRQIVWDAIRDIPDFPKKGIIFKDISTMISNAKAFSKLMDHLEERYKTYDLDYIAGIDARGFIFGAVLADRLGLGFVTVRKKGKLPYKTISKKYELEYGFDEIEVHVDAFNNENANVLLIDDLIATGGTAKAAEDLIFKAGAKCVETCFIMELPELKGRDKFTSPVYSVF